jgi:hypothetical protein
VIKGAVQDCLAYVAQQMRQAKFLRMIDREQRVQGGDGTLCVHQLRLCRRRQIFFVPSGGSFFNFQVANFGHQITILLAAVISQIQLAYIAEVSRKAAFQKI